MRISFHTGCPKGFWVYASKLRDAFANGADIGSGSYGRIIPVESRSNGIVAAKIATNNHGKILLEREGRIISPLPPHPNIVRHYAHGEIDGKPFLILERLNKGVDLDQISGTMGPIRLPHFFPTLVDIANGLDFLHSFGKVHRDIKPSSIFVFENQGTKILDFGITCNEGKIMRIEDEKNLIFKSPGYCSPSILLENPPTIQDDLYSLGLLSLDIFTGKICINEIIKACGYPKNTDGYIACHNQLEAYVLDCGLDVLETALVLKLTIGYEDDDDYFPSALHLLHFLEGIRTGKIFN